MVFMWGLMHLFLNLIFGKRADKKVGRLNIFYFSSMFLINFKWEVMCFKKIFTDNARDMENFLCAFC